MASALTDVPASQNASATPALSVAGKLWELLPTEPHGAADFTRATGLPQTVAQLLWQRGVRTAQDVQRFLNPTFDQLHDPFELCGMQEAVRRIVLAVHRSEPILIYGDYDVDGTLATVLLKTAIDRITPRTLSTLVRYHIPHRIREGYGVQASVLAQAASAGVRLVISVDTGIRAFAAAEEATRLGLDLIVTDHHLPEGDRIPQAVAVINPNQPDCSYPEKHLCGAAVAYKLAEALLRSAGEHTTGLHAVEPTSLHKLQGSLLKLVAIATVADAVPLTRENRAIVALGLAELRSVRQPGLRALLRLAQVGGEGVAPQAQQIAFRIAPRINAAGRMDVAENVVRLLLTRDPVEAEPLALKLHTLNEERQTVEATVLQEISDQLDLLLSETADEASGIYVLDGEDWHRGVVGILASRVVDRTYRPALVITHQDGTAHGSGRSVDGFHLLDALTAAHRDHLQETQRELFHRFGGHAHAVGFSLPSENVTSLRERLVRHAHAFATRPLPTLTIDAALSLDEADESLYRSLCTLQPFGQQNAEPIFLAAGLTVVDLYAIKERHLKLKVRTEQGRTLECVFWARSFSWPERAAAHGVQVGSHVDLAFQLRWSDHPTFGGLQLSGCDVRLSSAATPAL